MNDIAISVNGVTKRFRDVVAVKDLSFTVRRAECFGLLGPNGAGKTTMMKMLYGMSRREDPRPGQVSVFGHDPATDEIEIKFLSGIVPQEDNLDIELSVIQNLLVYARFYGMSRRDALPRIEELLAFMELTDKKNARINELSGGMKRRLTIARALLNSPDLLILDEPTTGLDPQVRHVIWDKVRNLKRSGVTVLLTTHYMDEAYQLCDHLIIMHRGEKVLAGNPVALVQQHIESYVLELLNIEHYDGIRLPAGVREERTDHRALLYAPSIQPLQRISKKLKAGEFFIRQANLEDLFLKITGRNLNE